MWRIGTFLAIGLAATAFAACGSDADSSGNSDGSSSSPTSEENEQDTAQVRLRQCLRENGVDVPDNPGQGGGGAENVDREKLQEALEGPCKELQTGAFGDVSEGDRQEFQDAFQKFAQCMRDEGVDVPDVSAGEGPPAGGGGLDSNDPDVQAATEQCRDELPQNAPGGGGE